MPTSILSLLPSILLVCSTLLQPVNPNDITGTWYTHRNEAIVEVYQHEGRYYGRILSLAQPLDKEGHPKKDHRNKDAHLKNRPLIGMNVLYDLQFNAAEQHWEGKVYIPLVGREANAIITLKNENTMRVYGFIGSEKVGKTQLWVRVKTE